MILLLSCNPNSDTADNATPETRDKMETENKTKIERQSRSGYAKVSIICKTDTLSNQFKKLSSFVSFNPDDIDTIHDIITAANIKVPAQKTNKRSCISFPIYFGVDKNDAKKTYYLVYDTVRENGFIKKDGSCYELTSSDAEKLIRFTMLKSDTTFMKENGLEADFFDKYGYTIDKLIYSSKISFSNLDDISGISLRHMYLAYANQCSIDIGLNMNKYQGQELSFKIYGVVEKFPYELHKTPADAVVCCVEKDKEIVGAFIQSANNYDYDSGLSTSYAAVDSLKTANDNPSNQSRFFYILYENKNADETERALAKLSPEQIVDKYIKALNDKDIDTALYCMPKEHLFRCAQRAMMNDSISKHYIPLPLLPCVKDYSSTDSESVWPPISTVKKVKLIKLEPLNPELSDTIKYIATIETEYSVELGPCKNDTKEYRIFMYNDGHLGWKISSITDNSIYEQYMIK